MIDNLSSDKLLFRAGYKCEYCHRSLFDALWQIEHIKPKAEGGTDNSPNLAVSCPRFNLNKNQASEGVEFVTARKTRLFNPWKDKWENHFGAVAGQLVGRTPIGRGMSPAPDASEIYRGDRKLCTTCS
jgi:5-methylcytosine-specific restriction endonuclease McrA